MNKIIETNNLSKHFNLGKGPLGKTKVIVKAVDDLSFSVFDNEILAIVGESGCGKSTLAKLILKLILPTKGEVNLFSPVKNLRKDVQVVFQDPLNSLDPMFRVKDILKEPFIIHRLVKKSDIAKRIKYLLSLVGLGEELLNRFSYELSGGQRQRICIARALSVEPKVLILDEPTSSLDVTVQKSILNLLMDFKQRFNLTYCFITHNIAIAKLISDRVLVMYKGKIVELAKKDVIFSSPAHPYTKLLLSAKSQTSAILNIKGEFSPCACNYYHRCPNKKPICKQKTPQLMDLSQRHYAACHFPLNQV